MVGARSGDRVAYVDTRSAFGAYRHGIPDWVIGTDWLAPAYPAPAPEPEIEAPEAATYDVAAWEPPPAAQVESDPEAEPGPAEVSFPSMGGDILHGVGARPKSEPPPQGVLAGAVEPVTG